MTDDALRQHITALTGQRALVLAGPGCGKTHLLTRRIIHANAVEGISFDDMLCLTFTNRASREMAARIRHELGSVPDNLFVGNLHRFCCRLLSDNALLPPDTSLLDEDDRDTWLSEALGARRKFERKQITDLAMRLFQLDHHFPEALTRKLDFTPDQAILDAAEAYRRYKHDLRLIDFDDLLLLTYLHLSESPPHSLVHSSYRWIQVDEVQDLTPLQLAIVDLVTADGPSTAVYLGDSRQAIFEFLGAGGPAIDRLRQRCADHSYRLTRNFRSPDYLVDLCNRFATTSLGLSSDSLAVAAANSAQRPDDALRLMSVTEFNLPLAVAACVRSWSEQNPDERIAILTRTNDEAEALSALLTAHGLQHTLVARSDLFRQASYKTICAHLSLLFSPVPSVSLARLLHRTASTPTLAEARSLVAKMKEDALTATDLLDPVRAAKLADPLTALVAEKFRSAYGPLHALSLRMLDDNTCSIADLMDIAHKHLTDNHFITPISRWPSVVDFIRRSYPMPAVPSPLAERLSSCIAELRTFNEGDLLEREHITVATVHKAKGLEFDNVVIYNAAVRDLPHNADEARVLYVAMSRARRRLAVFIAGRPSAHLTAVDHLFTHPTPDTVEATALIERLHSRHRP